MVWAIGRGEVRWLLRYCLLLLPPMLGILPSFWPLACRQMRGNGLGGLEYLEEGRKGRGDLVGCDAILGIQKR